MGQNESGAAVLESSETVEHLEKRFLIREHPYYSDSSFKLLHEKLTNKAYALRIFCSNDEEESEKLQTLICKKLAVKSVAVVPLHHYVFEEDRNYCSRNKRCFMIFGLGSGVNFRAEILRRRLTRQSFNEKELKHHLQVLTVGLLWLRHLSHPHGNINTQNIYIENDELSLSDPWIAPLCHASEEQYPAPEKILAIENRIQSYNPYAADLYSIGMCILEAGSDTAFDSRRCNQSSMHLQTQLNKYSNYPALSGVLREILLGDEKTRLKYLDTFSDRPNDPVLNGNGIKRTLGALSIQESNVTNFKKECQEPYITRENPFLNQFLHNHNHNYHHNHHNNRKPEVDTSLMQTKHLQSAANNPLVKQHSNNPLVKQHSATHIPISSFQKMPIREQPPSPPVYQAQPHYQMHNMAAVRIPVPKQLQAQPPLTSATTMLRVIPSPQPNYPIYLPYQCIQPEVEIKFPRNINYDSIIYRQGLAAHPQHQQHQRQLQYTPQPVSLGTAHTPSEQFTEDRACRKRIYENLKTLEDRVSEAINNTMRSLDNKVSNSVSLGNEQSKISHNDHKAPQFSSASDVQRVGESQSLSYQISDDRFSMQPPPEKREEIFREHEKQILFNQSQYLVSELNSEGRSSNEENVYVLTSINQACLKEEKNYIKRDTVRDQPSASVEADRAQNNAEQSGNKFETPSKMRESQIEAAKNLTIPEEQSSDEESIDGQPRAARGEYKEETYPYGGKYCGYVVDGMRNGEGTFYYKEGGVYIGHWKDNMMNGFGKLYYDTGDLAYEGQWYRDEFHGRGKVYNDGFEVLTTPFDYTNFEEIEHYWRSYEGDLSHDIKSGYGKIVLSNGESYVGQFRNDKISGKGVFTKIDGTIVRGVWTEGVLTS